MRQLKIYVFKIQSISKHHITNDIDDGERFGKKNTLKGPFGEILATPLSVSTTDEF